MKEMLEPYNVIYWIAVALAFAWGMLLALGFIAHGGDDVSADGHGHAGGGDSHDGGSDHHEGHESHSHGVMGFLGFGKAPTSFILIAMCMIWGLSGLLMNQALGESLKQHPGGYFWIGFVVAIAATVGLTRIASLGMARIFPTEETYTSSNKEMVGLIAQVDVEVTESSGYVMVSDRHGNLKQLTVRAEPGTGPFRPGSRVKLLSYLDGANTFMVGPVEASATSGSAQS